MLSILGGLPESVHCTNIKMLNFDYVSNVSVSDMEHQISQLGITPINLNYYYITNNLRNTVV